MNIYSFTLLFIMLISCNNKGLDKNLPKNNSYFLFHHVDEIVDSNTNATKSYQLSTAHLTNSERDSLKNILKEFGWEYKITADGEVLISIVAMQNLDNLFYLDSELQKRMKSIN